MHMWAVTHSGWRLLQVSFVTGYWTQLNGVFTMTRSYFNVALTESPECANIRMYVRGDESPECVGTQTCGMQLATVRVHSDLGSKMRVGRHQEREC